MIYYLTGLLLVVYLELLGQSFLSAIKKERDGFSFGTGFILVLTVAYVLTSILTAINCSFYLVMTVYTALFLLSLWLIVKERRNLKIRFHPLEAAFLLAAVVVLMWYSLRTSFGDLDGFDSTFYLNMVTNNIGLSKLNSRSVYYGNNAFSIQLQYTFQSYFYLASTLVFYVEKICALFHLPFYRMPCFVWPNQILFFSLTAALLTNAIRRSGNRNIGLIVLGIVLTVFYFGRFYFNNVFGFYGNSLRTLVFGEACCYLLDYQISKQKADKYLFYASLQAACACSSSSVFMCFFFLFALYFLWAKKEDSLLKEYSVVLLLPSIDLISVLRESITQGILGGIVLSLIIFLLNRPMLYLGRKKYARPAMLAVCVLAMIVLSYMVDGQLYHHDAFVYNNSQMYDMTINYFRYPPEAVKGIKYYKLVVLAILLLAMVFLRNDLTNVDLILVIVFFNPFCCAFLNKINPVFYRAYDIIINPFTLVFLLNALGNLIPVKYVTECGTLLLAANMLYFCGITEPIYYHASFKPQENFNGLYRMTQEELEVIDALSYEINYRGDTDPKIITANKLTQSMLKDGEFYFGRENKRNWTWSDAENELFNIFYPVEPYNDTERPDADFDHVCEYLKDADVRYVVQDKEVVFFDDEQNVWYSLTYLIDRCGVYPYYENDRYTAYRFE